MAAPHLAAMSAWSPQSESNEARKCTRLGSTAERPPAEKTALACTQERGGKFDGSGSVSGFILGVAQRQGCVSTPFDSHTKKNFGQREWNEATTLAPITVETSWGERQRDDAPALGFALQLTLTVLPGLATAPSWNSRPAPVTDSTDSLSALPPDRTAWATTDSKDADRLVGPASVRARSRTHRVSAADTVPARVAASGMCAISGWGRGAGDAQRKGGGGLGEKVAHEILPRLSWGGLAGGGGLRDVA